MSYVETISQEALLLVQQVEEAGDSLQESLEDLYLEVTRKKELWGGWRREGGDWITKPALKAAAFHLACRALYCPVCQSGDDSYMVKVGYVGTSEAEKFDCPRGHGSFTRRECFIPRTVAIEGGRQSGKTSSTLPEFCAWQLGYRPWDDTLTCPPVQHADWILASPTLKTSEGAALGARYERMMKKHIVRPLKNNAGWQLDAECHNARVHKFAYTQWEAKKNQQSNPWYDLIIMGVLWDEQPPAGARNATLRGLLKNRTTWGREALGASFTHSPYLRTNIRDVAFNRGGANSAVFCMGMATEDNPVHNQASIDEFLNEIPLQERDAWRTGEYAGDGYKALPMFDEERHVYSPEDGDVTGKHLHPLDPVILSVDPHTSKPWAIQLIALGHEDGVMRIFREWPEEDFEKLKFSKLALDDYTALIEGMMNDLPGGKDRVIRKLLDPRAGETPTAISGPRSLRELIRDKGLVFDTKFSASIDLRIERVRDALDTNKVLVADHCKNSRRALEHLHFKVDADGQIVRNSVTHEGRLDDEFKDFFDTFGFAAVVRLAPRPWRNP